MSDSIAGQFIGGDLSGLITMTTQEPPCYPELPEAGNIWGDTVISNRIHISVPKLTFEFICL